MWYPSGLNKYLHFFLPTPIDIFLKTATDSSKGKESHAADQTA